MAVVTIADRIDALRRSGFPDATVAAILGLSSSDVALFRADPENVPDSAQSGASDIAFTPAGTIAADNVQAAIEELDGDVTAIVGVPPGGTTAQVLTKLDDSDGNADWEDVPGGATDSLIVQIHCPAAAGDFALQADATVTKHGSLAGEVAIFSNTIVLPAGYYTGVLRASNGGLGEPAFGVSLTGINGAVVVGNLIVPADAANDGGSSAAIGGWVPSNAGYTLNGSGAPGDFAALDIILIRVGDYVA